MNFDYQPAAKANSQTAHRKAAPERSIMQIENWHKTERGRAMRREAQKRYAKTEKGRSTRLRSEKGIDLNGWRLTFEAQGRKCAICEATDPGTGGHGKWNTDHNHKTKKFRGILCSRCNWVLGHIKEDIVLLDRLKAYLMGHQCK